MNRIKNQKAFTLAEILITLGIIGVVAALTLPSLVQDYREKAQVVRLKKFYSAFSQAYIMALQDNGPLDTWGLTDSTMNDDGTHSDESLKSYDKFMQIMSKYLQKIEDGKLRKYTKGFILPDGTKIQGMWLVPSCDINDINAYCGDFYVRVNNKPREEYDGLFAFRIQPNRIYPFGTSNSEFKNMCLSGKNLTRCTGWVIMNENMDYLHCKDLDINTKTSCK